MGRTIARMERSQDLSGLCSDCLMLIAQLRATKEINDAESLRARIKELLSRLEYKARDAGIETEQVKQAQFALVAFIDEAITGVSFPEKDTWTANPLQLEFFNRYDAGEEFFKRLTQLRQRAQANSQVLEVYYLCMVLGFKGRYLYQDTEALRGLIEDTRADLSRMRDGRLTQAFAPHGKPQEGILEVVSKEVPAWVIGVTAAVVGFVLFVVMTLLINSAAEEVKAMIDKVH